MFENIEFDHYLTLKHVDKEHSHFPTGDADLVLVSSNALDAHPDWASKEAIQEIFGAVLVVINLEPSDKSVEKRLPHVAGELEFTYKNGGFETCLSRLAKYVESV